MSARPVILETPRLQLRELLDEDVPLVQALLPACDLVPADAPPPNAADARAWLQRQRDRYFADGLGPWLVNIRATAEPIGFAGLVMQALDGEWVPEVMYAFAASHRGRGYATEAAAAARDFAIDLRRHPRVIALVRHGDEAARGVATRIGLQAQRETVHAGLPHDVYAMTVRPHAPAGEVRLRFKKRRDAPAAFTVLRPDGSTSTQDIGRPGGYGPLHDLAHAVVEGTLGLRNGFLGLLADGWDFADFAWQPRQRLPDTALQAEALAGELARQVATDQPTTAADVLDVVRAAARPHAAFPPLADAQWAAMRDELGERWRQWQALPEGETLEVAITPGIETAAVARR